MLQTSDLVNRIYISVLSKLSELDKESKPERTSEVPYATQQHDQHFNTAPLSIGV